ncbi:MAG: proline iminopeptidase-family hydrolase [Ignavibacteriales bacterium]|nr:proline iminopeptidase-family hydrolase [Ignavibacteriales bacterium]
MYRHRLFRLFFGALFLSLFFNSYSVSQTRPEKVGYCEVPGGKIWYKITGSGTQPPLICIHGGPGGTSCTLSLLDSLSDERPVIRYDQLGGGRSDHPTDSTLWRIDRFVEELSTLVNHLQLKEYHLYGHSWGASLAVEYMITKQPKHVKSLILGGPLISTPLWIKDAAILLSTLPDSIQDIIHKNETAGTTDSPQYQKAIDEYNRRYLFHKNPHLRPSECEGVKSNNFIYKFMWGPSEFTATGNLKFFNRESDLHKLKLPVLLIVGEYDEARPKTVEHFKQLIPKATLVVIPEAGHVGLVDQTVQYIKQIRQFLKGVDSQ